ncbi:MAG: FAD:protein FMN transferase, partial [Nitrosopumilaceae archaeon]|nr:FAD:protein FMN transferase [Nitrosopumilaceae archaeon]
MKDTDNSSEYIRTINVSDMSVSTSGGYERYFLVDGKKYSHIIDPRTGFPVSHFSSVTVVSESPLFADALSTAFSVLSLDESKEIINQLDKIS